MLELQEIVTVFSTIYDQKYMLIIGN